eukprot:CAMPEP_0174265862 /NCGR_PEP_ID=MMETSP0439-20130205/28204_1 /TAXON_ID=0 /ORGANISM="Stereomyxa ramosa, Strain Chinc5" /LENGTH=805 /DNA_ID=CAMNT_0015352533 /DNA_START=8 /DNA_END=2425 /DNA_ORIENTATION=+
MSFWGLKKKKTQKRGATLPVEYFQNKKKGSKRETRQPKEEVKTINPLLLEKNREFLVFHKLTRTNSNAKIWQKSTQMEKLELLRAQSTRLQREINISGSTFDRISTIKSGSMTHRGKERSTPPQLPSFTSHEVLPSQQYSINLPRNRSQTVSSMFKPHDRSKGSAKREDKPKKLRRCKSLPDLSVNRKKRKNLKRVSSFPLTKKEKSKKKKLLIPNGLNKSAMDAKVNKYSFRQKRRPSSVHLDKPIGRSTKTQVEQGDVVFDFSVDNSRQVISGTKEKLSWLVFREKLPDNDFIRTYLVIHKHFMTSTELIDKCAFYVNNPESDTAEEINFITLRVAKVLRMWLRYCPKDFLKEKKMKKKLTEILSQIREKNGAKANNEIKEIEFMLKQMRKRQKVDLTEAPRPLSKLKDKASVLSYCSEEIARQLTLKSFNIFKELNSEELFHTAWSSAHRESNAPNILALIENFNNICYSVATSIVQTSNLKYRTSVMCKWIDVGRDLLKLNNYHDSMVIYSAMNMSAIQLLKTNWRQIPSKHIRTLKEMDRLFSPMSNFSNYRHQIREIFPPCLPILSLALQQLTALEELSDVLENNFINFSKMTKLANITLELTKFQGFPYAFHPVPDLLELIQKLPRIPDKEIYALAKADEESATQRFTISLKKLPNWNDIENFNLLVKEKEKDAKERENKDQLKESEEPKVRHKEKEKNKEIGKKKEKSRSKIKEKENKNKEKVSREVETTNKDKIQSKLRDSRNRDSESLEKESKPKDKEKDFESSDKENKTKTKVKNKVPKQKPKQKEGKDKKEPS